MASNHLPGNADLTTYGRPLFSGTVFDGVGFGLGVSVAVDPVKAKVPMSVGEFGWGGAASTTYWVDPVLDLSVVFMTQLLRATHSPCAANSASWSTPPFLTRRSIPTRSIRTPVDV